ncbi:unnamed protein product [Rhizophagus irregularis]|nr:unnamed protein product [Rhizophagus irregularis]
MGRDKLSGMLKEICNITGIDCTNKRIVNHSLRKYTAQKLNDEGLDSQAIMNVTLHRSLAGLNVKFKCEKIQCKENLNEAAISNAEEIDISSETEREPLSEIQNTVPSKRKNDLVFNNSKLNLLNVKTLLLISQNKL